MMMKFGSKRVSRLMLALTLMLGMVASAVGTSVAHLPIDIEAAEQTRHAELASIIDDHGHSHDDGEAEEQHVGHNHGHNPADHSHEIPHLNMVLHSLDRDMKSLHFVAIPKSNDLGSYSRLDRPPKSIS